MYDWKLLGKQIQKVRKYRDIKADDFAEICSISYGYLRQIESGLAVPSLEIFLIVCHKLNIDPNYLLSPFFDKPSKKTLDSIANLETVCTTDQLVFLDTIITAANDLLV